MCIICTQKGFTALHVAAKYGHLEAMRLLLQDKRVDVNITGKNGLTPLHVATHYDNFDVIMMLMQHSANTHAVAKVGNSFAIVTLTYLDTAHSYITRNVLLMKLSRLK